MTSCNITRKLVFNACVNKAKILPVHVQGQDALFFIKIT